MKIFRIANKIGTDFSVSSNRFWSSRWKLEEVWNNILEGRLSLSKGSNPIVSKSLELKNAYFVMDGHHRILEGLMDGSTEIVVHWNEHLPYIDAGIGNELPSDKIRVVDFINEKRGNNEDI